MQSSGRSFTRRVYRVASWTVFALAAVWIVTIPVAYFVILDRNFIIDAMFSLSILWRWLFLSSQVIGLPLVLIVKLREIGAHVDRKTIGLLAGIAAGFLFSTWLLTVPYVGAYPSAVLGWIGLLVRKTPFAEPQVHITIIITNLVLWPLFGLWVNRRERHGR